ncbi:hypothetical protein ABBQ32_006563 [Trebouxia sp. C0010 RCD-2024]
MSSSAAEADILAAALAYGWFCLSVRVAALRLDLDVLHICHQAHINKINMIAMQSTAVLADQVKAITNSLRAQGWELEGGLGQHRKTLHAQSKRFKPKSSERR